jgi:hypothetical protein
VHRGRFRQRQDPVVARHRRSRPPLEARPTSTERAAAACRHRRGVIRWRWCWPRASGGRNGSATISTRASMTPGWRNSACRTAAMSWEVARCSTGERQRLALLRTLMQAPAALLLDEPTGNLDQESTQRVEGLLTGYQRQRQAALLWVSHDPGQIERVAQRASSSTTAGWPRSCRDERGSALSGSTSASPRC